MRTLEGLLLLSFVPSMLMPVLPLRWRRYIAVPAAILPTLVGAVHIIVEGWRIQLVPVYVLALLVLAARGTALLRNDTTLRGGRGMIIAFLSLAVVVSTGILAGYLLPVVQMPEPTGPYAVGIVDRELVDGDRGRRLMASIWYPADRTGPRAPLLHAPDTMINGLAESFGLPALALQHLRYFTVSASEAVPLAADGPLLPVLVFSHGLVGLRIQNSSALQELASWGYVVVALDHTDASAVTVFPDGEARYFDMARFDIRYIDDAQYAREVNDKLFPVWVDDQRFAYDTLETWMTDDPLLRGRLDLNRISSFGHSFGGATALEVCRIDMRCRAAVNLDGGIYGDIRTLPAVRPLMLMTSAESYENHEAVGAWRSMMDAATGPTYWLELPDSTHFSFTITQLLSPILVPPNFEPRAGLRATDKYLRMFFDLYVRENASVRLAPQADGSDVRWITD